MEYVLLGMAVLFCLAVMTKIITYSVNKTVGGKIERPAPWPSPPAPTVDLKPLQKQIDDLPNKVLTSITNSTNTYKGALGELIGYINLRASYDRIIPLGSIVDFVCIKFPDKEHPGCVDFVDVKTGHKARLSKDQRSLQQLIKDKKINFCQLKVEASDADHTR